METVQHSKSHDSASNAGVKIICRIHELAISQFWVPFTISLCGCPCSLPEACIIWAIMEPICRGAMTSSWPRPADALPCSPITRICGGDHSLILSLSAAYGSVRPLPPSRGIGWILELLPFLFFGDMCSFPSENSRAMVGLSYWKTVISHHLGHFPWMLGGKRQQQEYDKIS